MTRTRWNAQRPTSLRHALELCLNYARATHNRSVENLAFHRANVHKASQPELGLFDGEDE